jgi:hypothetical protein
MSSTEPAAIDLPPADSIDEFEGRPLETLTVPRTAAQRAFAEQAGLRGSASRQATPTRLAALRLTPPQRAITWRSPSSAGSKAGSRSSSR